MKQTILRLIPRGLFARIVVCSLTGLSAFIVYAAPSETFKRTPFSSETGRTIGQTAESIESEANERHDPPLFVKPNILIVHKVQPRVMRMQPPPESITDLPAKLGLEEKNIDWQKELIRGMKFFEGFRANRYICPGGVPTIGYGATNPKIVNGGTISKERAEKILKDELSEARKIVNRIVTIELTEYEKAALTSFTFNLGATRLKKLVSGPNRLNSGNKSSVERILPLYKYANGEVKTGLVKRRAWELSLFMGAPKELRYN